MANLEFNHQLPDFHNNDKELDECDELMEFDIFSGAIFLKRFEIVDFIIRKDFKKASKNKRFNTLLHLAVDQEDISTIEFLLSRKASIKVKNYLSETPLHLAAKKNNIEIIDIICNYIFQGGNDRHNPNPTDTRGLSHMHIACISNSTVNDLYVQHFLKLGISANITVNSNSPQWPGYTPLHFAVEHNNVKIGKLLLEYGADVSIKNTDGSTPLHIAFLKTCMRMVDLLLDSHKSFDRNVNPVNSVGLSHFHIACSKNDTSIVQQFLDRGANVNTAIHSDSWEFCGFTPVHMAVQFECTKTITLLINHGANMVAKEAKGLTPLHLAFKNKCKKIVNLLLTLMINQQNENPTNEWGLSHFHIACIYNKLDIVKSFLKCGVSIDDPVSKDSSIYPGYTALHLAAEYERVELADILLKGNARVDSKEVKGLTPLHLACRQNVEKISNLIEQNVDVNSRMHHYELESKVNDITTWFNNRTQYAEMIKLLLKYNSGINTKDFFDRTPLYHACEISPKILEKFAIKITAAMVNKLDSIRNEVINILVHHGADILSANEYTGNTILHHLIETNECLFFIDRSKVKIVELFLSKGAEVNVKTVTGLTLLHLAVIKGLPKVVEVLLKYKAEVNTVENENFETPLHNACENLSTDIVRMLIEHNANVNARKKDGKTALYNVVSNSNFDYSDSNAESSKQIVTYLLEAGCDVNVQDYEGKTPLHIACSALNYVGAHILLQNGADINIGDDSGKAPLSYCLFHCRGTFHQIYYTFYEHIKKLKYIGYYVSEKNRTYCRRILDLRNFAEGDKYLVSGYLKEFKVMHYKRIGSSTLYNMLHKDLNELAIYVKNKTFKKIITAKKFGQKFPFFGYLLKLQYKKGCARASLMKSAKEALEFLIKCDLPEVCTEQIFKHLDNENLKSLIKTNNTVVEKRNTKLHLKGSKVSLLENPNHSKS